eukprot:scaffold120703_cov75-Phaeocystis_antarctica.AAC.5
MKRLSLLALLTLAPAYSAWNMHCGNLSSHFVLSAVRLPLTPAAIAAAAARWHAQLDQHLIPRLLHYTWSDCSSVPPRQSAWQKGCARVNPLHQQWLWSDDDNHALVATHYPQFLDLYDSYDEHMKRVDAARLFYLHRFGGTYMDMDLDFACLRPLDELPLASGRTRSASNSTLNT